MEAAAAVKSTTSAAPMASATGYAIVGETKPTAATANKATIIFLNI